MEDIFDVLVEQQDQEIALYGSVSPLTRLRLDALARGEAMPILPVSPAIQRLTEKIRARRMMGQCWEVDDESED